VCKANCTVPTLGPVNLCEEYLAALS
jgi:hypothetical protein